MSVLYALGLQNLFELDNFPSYTSESIINRVNYTEKKIKCPLIIKIILIFLLISCSVFPKRCHIWNINLFYSKSLVYVKMDGILFIALFIYLYSLKHWILSNFIKIRYVFKCPDYYFYFCFLFLMRINFRGNAAEKNCESYSKNVKF